MAMKYVYLSLLGAKKLLKVIDRNYVQALRFILIDRKWCKMG